MNDNGLFIDDYLVTGTSPYGLTIANSASSIMRGGNLTVPSAIRVDNSGITFTAVDVIGSNSRMRGFANALPTAMDNSELVTWGFFKSLIDAMFPIGCLQLSTNTSKPATFGYIEWAVTTWANDRYIKLTSGSLSMNAPMDTGAAAVGTHTHGSGTLSTSSVNITSGTNTTFEGIAANAASGGTGS
jgi:hypothetical protein